MTVTPTAADLAVPLAVRLVGEVQAGTLGDQVDYYGVALMAGQVITVQATDGFGSCGPTNRSMKRGSSWNSAWRTTPPFPKSDALPRIGVPTKQCAPRPEPV